MRRFLSRSFTSGGILEVSDMSRLPNAATSGVPGGITRRHDEINTSSCYRYPSSVTSPQCTTAFTPRSAKNFRARSSSGADSGPVTCVSEIMPKRTEPLLRHLQHAPQRTAEEPSPINPLLVNIRLPSASLSFQIPCNLKLASRPLFHPLRDKLLARGDA